MEKNILQHWRDCFGAHELFVNICKKYALKHKRVKNSQGAIVLITVLQFKVNYFFSHDIWK